MSHPEPSAERELADEPGVELGDELRLPCGVTLKNRIAKSAMSDSLGDGCGAPTDAQLKLYQSWAEGGASLLIIGEVQGNPEAAEKPGNLVLSPDSPLARFEALATAGSANNTQLWLQLGHAGALTHPPIGTPIGPSVIDLPTLQCAAMTREHIEKLPQEYARTAQLAMDAGFGGVQIHAAHGFLLSQFLSPLFNQRTDEFGGDIHARMRLLLSVIEAVRAAVNPSFAVAVKINSSDQLNGGLTEQDSLAVIKALDSTAIDLVDISGGTYFPGATAASDKSGSGPYFAHFAQRARSITSKPLMLTGGFKSGVDATQVVRRGDADVIGVARSLILEPALPMRWLSGDLSGPVFPRFDKPPEGGVTAWYTRQIARVTDGLPQSQDLDLHAALREYNSLDHERAAQWNAHFGRG